MQLPDLVAVLNNMRSLNADSAGLKYLLLSLALLMGACAAPAHKADVIPEPVMTRSSDLFWQHIDEAAAHDRFYLLSDYREALAWRLTIIDSAHHAIDLETFLWSDDEAGMRVLSHLLAAADRGVRVRLLLDDAFTPDEDLLLHSIDSHPNIELRIYNPYSNRIGTSSTERILFNLDDFQRVNHRMHNKALIVDGWVAGVGGRNLADEYFGLHGQYNFRDMEVIAMGDSVETVSDHFARFWNSGWAFPVQSVMNMETSDADLEALRKQLFDAVGTAEVATNVELEQRWLQVASGTVPGKAEFFADDPPHVDPALASEAPSQLAGYLVQSLSEAQEEVVIVNAYLVPTEELLSVIKQSLARGVKIRILTNSIRSNNHLAAHAAYQGYVRELVESGVQLYEMRTDARDRRRYMRDPVDNKQLGLHAKFLLIDDDRAFIGSSNLDPRSLKLNTEVGMMVHSQELNQLLREQIAIDFEPGNAWLVSLDEQGALVWQADDRVLNHPPANSTFQQLEDWFIGLLPIDSTM